MSCCLQHLQLLIPERMMAGRSAQPAFTRTCWLVDCPSTHEACMQLDDDWERAIRHGAQETIEQMHTDGVQQLALTAA